MWETGEVTWLPLPTPSLALSGRDLSHWVLHQPREKGGHRWMDGSDLGPVALEVAGPWLLELCLSPGEVSAPPLRALKLWRLMGELSRVERGPKTKEFRVQDQALPPLC